MEDFQKFIVAVPYSPLRVRLVAPEQFARGGRGSDGAFITVSDFLMDGGVTAAYWFGDLAAKMP